MKYNFNVPKEKRIRVIISTDAKNEADDQFAVTHALLTPRFIVRGLVATHFERKKARGSMEASYEELIKVVSLMRREGTVEIAKGAAGAIEDEETPNPSEGAELIIREALREEDAPLYVLCIGALTDLASAYLMEPRIASRMTGVWVGGGAYPEGHEEFNLMNDVAAANVVFRSEIPLWQIPVNVSSVMKATLAEFQVKVQPCGKIGDYLFRQLAEVVRTESGGESWIFWDSATIGVLLDEHGFWYDMRKAPVFDRDMRYMDGGEGRKIRVYRFIEPRFIFEDFFCKLALAGTVPGTSSPEVCTSASTSTSSVGSSVISKG